MATTKKVVKKVEKKENKASAPVVDRVLTKKERMAQQQGFAK